MSITVYYIHNMASLLSNHGSNDNSKIFHVDISFRIPVFHYDEYLRRVPEYTPDLY